MRRPSSLPLLLIPLLLLLAPAAAQAQEKLEDKILGIERTLFDLPDSGAEVDITRFEAAWKGGIINDTFRYQHDEGGAIVTFKVINPAVLKDGIDTFDASIARVVKEVKKKGAPRKGKINDMPAFALEGEGLCGDDPCFWAARLYQSRDETLIAAFAFVNKDKGDARLKEATDFITAVDLSDEEREARRIPRKAKPKKKR